MTPVTITDNYILITSDEEIKGGDYFYKSSFNRPARNGIIEMAGSFDKKIIAHLPLNNEPQLEGVPLLPPLPNEDDVEKLVNNYIQELIECKSVKESEITWISAICHQSIIKAKERYRFTEEDIRFIILKSFLLGVDRGEYSKQLEDRLVSSLSQPKLPVGFNCRIEYLTSSPKIINGVMQGEWIFE